MKKQILNAVSLLLLLAVLQACGDKKTATIYMIGDSTMATKKQAETNPECGWGHVLGDAFTDKVTVHNHAVNGRSSKSFIAEGRWQTVLDSLKKDDYLIVQFGHNDQKEYDPKRYTNPYSSYYSNLAMFVDKAREKGAHPILVSSIVRRHFNEKGTLVDTHGAYPFATRMLAVEKKVPFVDLQSMTEKAVSEMGSEKSIEWYLHLAPGESTFHPDGKKDDTHLNKFGAAKVAGMFVADLAKQGHPLQKFIKQ